MNYKVILYRKGVKTMQTNVDAKSHVQAAKLADSLGGKKWTHVCVIGKTIRRYNKHFKLISALPKAFKTTRDKSYGILLMFGGTAEFHMYVDEKARDSAYEKVAKQCMELESAASAKADPQPTDITVSSEETNGSKSGSTSKKISNGFAMSAIWTDLETLSSTDEISGSDKYDAMEKSTWKAGYEVYPSEPKQKTLWATVEIDGANESEYPSINRQMKRINGKTIEVYRSDDGITKNLYYGAGYFWLAKWLNFDIIKAVSLPVPVGVSSNGVDFVDSMVKHIGDIMNLYKCSNHWHSDNGWCYAQEWLSINGYKPNKSIPPDEVEAITRELQEVKKKYSKMFTGDYPMTKPVQYLVGGS